MRDDTIGVIVDEFKIIAIVYSPQVSLSNSETNTVGKSLAKGASGNLNTWMRIRG